MAQPLTAPAENPPLTHETLDQETKAELAQALSRSTLAQSAQAAAANGSPDQLGWKAREHIAPLFFHIPALSKSIISKITQPFSAGYVPLMHVVMHRGGSLMAPSKDPKPASRSIATVHA